MAARGDWSRFAAWLSGELRRQQMSPADLARRLDKSNATVGRWLKKERQPSSASCELISDVLFVDLDTVLEVAGHRPRTPIRRSPLRTRLLRMADQIPEDRLPWAIGNLEAVRVTDIEGLRDYGTGKSDE
jgi:transcriptional regulator with XRE-family HTH domain